MGPQPLRSFPVLLVTLMMISVGLVATGCRKKSHAYLDASGRYDTLVARAGNEACLEPEMANVEAILKTVPDGDEDAPKAAELLKTISTCRAAASQNKLDIAATLSKLKEVAPSTPSAGSAQPAPARAAAAADGGVDAGDDVGPGPKIGTKTVELEQKYSICFQRGASVQIGGATPFTAETWELKESYLCQKQYPGHVGRSLIMMNGAVRDIFAKGEVKAETKVIDAGGPQVPRLADGGEVQQQARVFGLMVPALKDAVDAGGPP